MIVLQVLGGLVLGFGLAFGFAYTMLHVVLQLSGSAAMVIALISGAIGGVYSAIAFGYRIYGFGVFSILGYVLDMTWSLLNTAASLLVWLPACLIAGEGFIPPDEYSRRSGTFVYNKNPRGGGYGATTIGTVIGGGWCSHEEVHVWQARIFGPFYLLMYIASLLLNLLFRLVTGKTDEIVEQAYYRVCFEDWAYAAGSTSGGAIHAGMWILWFLLSLVYVSLCLVIVLGFGSGSLLLGFIAIGGLIAYSLIRSLTPTNA